MWKREREKVREVIDEGKMESRVKKNMNDKQRAEILEAMIIVAQKEGTLEVLMGLMQRKRI